MTTEWTSGTAVVTLAPGTWTCELHVNHGTAKPIRGMVHHIQPQGAGGPDTLDNKTHICANGHDAVHAIMWALVNDRPTPRCAKKELAMAKEGIRRWEAAGRPGSTRAFMG